MMRWKRTGVAALIGMIACVGRVQADAPKLLRSEPANGAPSVAVDVGVLRLHFDRDMRTDAFTCWKSPLAAFPPPDKEAGGRWRDVRTFELGLKQLKPGTEYAVQLNADQRQGFRAADGQPLPITTVRFKTVPATAAPRQDIYDPDAEPSEPAKPRQDVYDPGAEPAKPTERGHLLKCGARVGQVSQMSQMVRLQLTITASASGGQETQKIDQLFKLRYTEENLEVADGRPVRVKRKVQLAQAMMKNPDTGEVQREDMPLTGVEAELRVRPDGSMELVSVSQGDRSVAAEMASESQWFSLVPGRAANVGESWKLSGGQLRGMLAALDATEGEITMRLAKVEKDPQMKKDVAKLEGRIRGRMQIEALSADLDGTISVDFVPELGLPFLRKFEGTLRVNQTIEAEGERVKIVGEGRMEAVEERALLGGSDSSPSPPPQSTPWPGDQSRRTPAGGGPGANTVAFHRVSEPNEQAFSMLIPQGWQVEGGIVRVDPVSTGAAAQAIAAKLSMVIKKDAAGTVMVQLIPSVLYVDNRGSPAAGGFPPGSMMNGMPVAYKVSAEDFLTRMVFPQIRPAAQGVRVVEQKKLPQLSAACQRRSASIPLLGAQLQHDAALVTLEYTESGARFRERMITLIRDYGRVGAGMWDNLETASFRAPADQFARWEPVTHVMRESVKLNTRWVVGEVRGQLIRAGIHADAQAEAQRVGREIAEHRRKTNAEINNDMYLTLTSQEEYVNPYTKEVEVDSGEWRHRWINESGEIVFTNDENYDPNIVPNPPFNRTDFKRSQTRPR